MSHETQVMKLKGESEDASIKPASSSANVLTFILFCQLTPTSDKNDGVQIVLSV